jgi:hypothetical protein
MRIFLAIIIDQVFCLVFPLCGGCTIIFHQNGMGNHLAIDQVDHLPFGPDLHERTSERITIPANLFMYAFPSDEPDLLAVAPATSRIIQS